MMNMKVKVNKPLIKKYMQAKEKALVAMGVFMQDAVAVNTVRITGTLANSWTYATKKNQGNFGMGAIVGDPKIPLTDAAKVSVPQRDDVVRTGSGLVYAGPYERKRNVLKRTIDMVQGVLWKIVAATYRSV